MHIPGVPDEHVERLHSNRGSGRGTLGYRHWPSGITVHRDCLVGASIHTIDADLLAELGERLRAEGLLAAAGEPAD
jgi:hypothetical protein